MPRTVYKVSVDSGKPHYAFDPEIKIKKLPISQVIVTRNTFMFIYKDFAKPKIK